jgi:hypothetical protein
MIGKIISHLPREIKNIKISHGVNKIIEKLGSGGPVRRSHYPTIGDYYDR